MGFGDEEAVIEAATVGGGVAEGAVVSDCAVRLGSTTARVGALIGSLASPEPPLINTQCRGRRANGQRRDAECGDDHLPFSQRESFSRL